MLCPPCCGARCGNRPVTASPEKGGCSGQRRDGPRRGLPGECDTELTAPGGQLQLASDTPESHRLASFQVYDLREALWGAGWAKGLPLIVGDPGAHLDPAGRRGQGPHLAKRWEPRGFSRVAAAFSSYDGDLSLPLVGRFPVGSGRRK